MSVTTVKWTVADYHRIIAAGILEGRNVELIGGEIIWHFLMLQFRSIEY